MYIPCLQTKNNFRQGTLENYYGHKGICIESELERNMASSTPTGPVLEMNI